MQSNKTGYILLYLLSFCISTGIFHAVANAQESPIFSPTKVRLVQPVSNVPTPTVFVQSPVVQTARVSTQTNPTAEPTVIAPTTVKPTVPVATPTLFIPTPTTIPTPTEIPTPQPTIAVAYDLESLFDKYSAEYGADKELLKKIAKCESGFNPTSNNSGMYLGMYQFASSTWSANRNRMGMDPNPDLRTNAEEAIRTASYMIAKGGQGHWPNCH